MTLRQWGMILLTAALFGSSFFFIKLAVTDLPPMTIAAGRALIAAGQTRVDSLLGGILFARSRSSAFSCLALSCPTSPMSAGRIAGTLIALAGVAFLTERPWALAPPPRRWARCWQWGSSAPHYRRSCSSGWCAKWGPLTSPPASASPASTPTLDRSDTA